MALIYGYAILKHNVIIFRAVKMEQGNQENEPLLGVERLRSNNRSALQRLWLKFKENWKLIVPFTVASTLLVGYFVAYFIILPTKIQDAINGHGSRIYNVNLRTVDPIMVDLSMLIPLDDPPPVDVNVNLGKLTMVAIEDGLIPRVPLCQFDFPLIDIKAKETQVWVNTTLSLFDFNYAWISWFISTGLKHGFPHQDVLL